METQPALHLIEWFRATQSERGFLFSWYNSNLFSNDVGDPFTWLDSPQDEGRLFRLVGCHASVKKVSNYLHGWRGCAPSFWPSLRLWFTIHSLKLSRGSALLLIAMRYFVRG